ncbi:hypothetical protein SAMN05421780_11410 [Flexibacter flexilis DSM 6793]|uniref:Uncharacterized protein n=1 Tax=Flexibacter flexilis DSM 6793 TaxID=927664 RepID=A0A1I1NCM1_9BACT|nr:hypothetical protein [Flexibacter flexilis]SFC95225.1 hypothetical protein SAMN05421780_11410 [Flexibacter flexilis DSM 6793]
MALEDLTKAQLIEMLAAKDKEIATQQAALEDKDKQLLAQQEESDLVIADITARLDVAQQASLVAARKFGKFVVTHKDKSYRVAAPKFNVPPFGVISAEELLNRPDVVAALLEMGSSVLVAVQEGEE